MTQPGGRKQALVGLTATALLGLGIFAPAASAQVGDLTDTVNSTTTTVTDTVDKTTDTATTTTGSTTDKVTDTVDTVGGTVDSTTGTKTYEDTKDTVTTTTDSATETLNDTTGTVGGAVEEASGGLVSDPNLTVESPLADKQADKKSSGGTSSSTKTGGGSGSSRSSQIAALREAREAMQNRLASLTASERNRGMGSLVATSSIIPQRESFFSNLAEAAREALKKAAFPLGLALMVGAFLMVQGRIDRKDAKLALAPIDSEQDLLSFQ